MGARHSDMIKKQAFIVALLLAVLNELKNPYKTD
jgi:hypothetical protein